MTARATAMRVMEGQGLMDAERLTSHRRGRHWSVRPRTPTTPTHARPMWNRMKKTSPAPLVLRAEPFATSECHSCHRVHRSVALACKPG